MGCPSVIFGWSYMTGLSCQKSRLHSVESSNYRLKTKLQEMGILLSQHILLAQQRAYIPGNLQWFIFPQVRLWLLTIRQLSKLLCSVSKRHVSADVLSWWKVLWLVSLIAKLHTASSHVDARMGYDHPSGRNCSFGLTYAGCYFRLYAAIWKRPKRPSKSAKFSFGSCLHDPSNLSDIERLSALLLYIWSAQLNATFHYERTFIISSTTDYEFSNLRNIAWF